MKLKQSLYSFLNGGVIIRRVLFEFSNLNFLSLAAQTKQQRRHVQIFQKVKHEKRYVLKYCKVYFENKMRCFRLKHLKVRTRMLISNNTSQCYIIGNIIYIANRKDALCVISNSCYISRIMEKTGAMKCFLIRVMPVLQKRTLKKVAN